MALFWGAIVFWILAWSINIWIARQKEKKILNLFPPTLFGASIVFIWQATVLHFEISPIILPPPSAIYYKFISSTSILWEDFVQTVVKGALSGYLIGCVIAFAVSLIADKFKFFWARCIANWKLFSCNANCWDRSNTCYVVWVRMAFKSCSCSGYGLLSNIGKHGSGNENV